MPSCLEKLIKNKDEIAEQIINKINESNFEALKIKADNIKLKVKIAQINNPIHYKLSNMNYTKRPNDDHKYHNRLTIEHQQFMNETLKEKLKKCEKTVLQFINLPEIQEIIKKHSVKTIEEEKKD